MDDDFYCDHVACTARDDPDKRGECCAPFPIVVRGPSRDVPVGEHALAHVCVFCIDALSSDRCDACELPMLDDGLHVDGFGMACVLCIEMLGRVCGASPNVVETALACRQFPPTGPHPCGDDDPELSSESMERLAEDLERVADARAAGGEEWRVFRRPYARQLVQNIPGLRIEAAVAIVRVVGSAGGQWSAGTILNRLWELGVIAQYDENE